MLLLVVSLASGVEIGRASISSPVVSVNISNVGLYFSALNFTYPAISTPIPGQGFPGFSEGAIITIAAGFNNTAQKPVPTLNSIKVLTPGFQVVESKLLIGQRYSQGELTDCLSNSTTCVLIPMQSWAVGPISPESANFTKNLPQWVPLGDYVVILMTVQLPSSTYVGPLEFEIS